MTSEMIKEMMQNGCSIGSHSVSHPFPNTIRKKRNEGQESYQKFLHSEFGDSKTLLQKKYYQYLYTCIPGKTKRDTPKREIPRYIVLGKDKDDYIFKHATTFKASSKSRATVGAIFAKTEHPVSPDSGQKITSRLPTITANLSSITNLDPETVEMRIAGLGKVPAIYDPLKKEISWTVNRPLRFPSCVVTVRWRLEGENNHQPALTWTFVIDREAAYLPKTQ